jgi:mannose-6-phosphate isomerase-like protein (cupin superfamily)
MKTSEVKSTDRDDYQETPRPLAGMAKDFVDGFRIEPHSHPRAQLTWAVTGVMTVTAARGTWVVPPNRALRIPAETEHSIRMLGAVAMRAIYVDPAVAKTIAGDCKVILVSSLLRALMLELVAAPLDYDLGGRLGRVEALFLDEIRALDAQPLHIPMPRTRVCAGSAKRC